MAQIDPPAAAVDPPHAERLTPSLGLVGLTLFGIGNMLGAGIYGLIGTTAGKLGNATWMAFAASVVAAGCTGLTYASLGSRYPRAGGAAYITERAFRQAWLASTVGLVVAVAGLVSMAAGSRIFADYFVQVLPQLHPIAVIVPYIVILAGINLLGMRQSSWMNALCTTIEASGLLFVIAVGMRYWGDVDLMDATTPSNPAGSIGPALILNGAALTFYAFIGFEDVLNVSEEVKEPKRTIPIALLLAVTITTIIYMAVAITAVSVVKVDALSPQERLELLNEKPAAQPGAAPSAPVKTKALLLRVVEEAAPWVPPTLFAVIAMFAVANTGLLNYVMASRLTFGMARDGLLPEILGRLHPTRRTPIVAIAILGAIVVALAVTHDLGNLAAATSILLLTSFVVMNTSMLVLKYRRGEPKGSFEVPGVIPAVAIIVCIAMIVQSKWEAQMLAAIIAGSLLLVSITMSLAMKRRRPPELPGNPPSLQR